MANPLVNLLSLGAQALKAWGPSLVSKTGRGIRSVSTFAAKNPKFSFATGGIMVGQFTGNGALRTWENWLLGGDEKETTAEKLNRTLNGDSAKGGNLVGDTLDSVAGKGTSKAVVDSLRTARDTVADATRSAKNAVVDGAGAAKDYVAGLTPSSPSLDQYADQQMQQFYNYNPVQHAGQNQYRQGGGVSLSDFSPFTGFKNLLNQVTGGNTNLMSVAAMIPAAMLMFGNFGWMGKVASLMLGSMAVKNLNHPSLQTYVPNPQIQIQPQQVQELYQRNYQIAMGEGLPVSGNEDNRVVMRGRG